ncbi:MAG: molybdenum cofactor guanylyltransferase [Chloroflexota bacterium]
MTRRRVTGVVLAGGRSSRFEGDKLAARVDGRTLLANAIDGVTPASVEILVVAAPGATPRLPRGATLIHDPVAFEGPLAGLEAGLRAAHESLVIVVGGDMPTLVGAVVESMLVELDQPDVDAVVLEHDGRARPLPLAVRREPAMAAATRLLADGERRLRALPEALATRVIPESTWRVLDPEARTIHDIDTPADLG